MAYKYEISGCEALKQGGFDFYISDVLHYIKVGDATVNQLKGAGILPDKSYGSLNVHKPDGLIVNEKNSIQVLVEYKKPGEFSSSKAALDLIYSWYFKLADKLNCNVICITDGDNTYWFHAKSHMQITDEKGNFLHYLLDISRLTDNKMTIEEKRSLASLVNRFAKISNKGQLEAEITLNPQELANNVWQKIWISTGTIGC